MGCGLMARVMQCTVFGFRISSDNLVASLVTLPYFIAIRDYIFITIHRIIIDIIEIIIYLYSCYMICCISINYVNPRLPCFFSFLILFTLISINS
jgi:hypothetical protein